MGADECANWDYKKQPTVATVAATCNEFIQKLHAAPDSQVSALRDTRPFHLALFKAAVPPACKYLAGNYRGSDHSCLKHRNVGMGGRAGAPCGEVDRLMINFHAGARLSLGVLEAQLGRKPARSPDTYATLMRYIAETVSTFQDIHPYADGNGHIGRLFVWVVLGHFNLLPEKWWLHENPGLDWDTAVREHQTGDPERLQSFLLHTIC